ncbi:hypothetical protein CPB97_001600 [Podila verticillata]|nr:hypothetical protein CPB97_001600 [Podila verticillata]
MSSQRLERNLTEIRKYFHQTIAPEYTQSPKTIVRKSLTHDVETDIFFNSRDPKDILFGSLQDGEQLPDWIWSQPDYNFELQLDGLDLGNKITKLYNDVRKQKDLDHTKVDHIALLSGIIHICDGNFGLSKSNVTTIHNAVVDLYYSKELSEADVTRARKSEDLWSTWVREVIIR